MTEKSSPTSLFFEVSSVVLFVLGKFQNLFQDFLGFFCSNHSFKLVEFYVDTYG